MADAYCGPSNPLQSLQKHSSVDRTLQQDRLTARHGPSSQQGFRSSPGPSTGLLDAEFDAFQAGLNVPTPFSPPHQSLPFLPPHQHAGSLAPSQAQSPNWAADFQRLHVSSPPPPVQLNAPPPQNVGSWHMDFMKHQQAPAPSTSAQIPQQYHSTQSHLLGRPQGFPISGGSPFSSAMMDTRNHLDLRSGAPVATEAESMNQSAFESMFDEVAAEHKAQEMEKGKGKTPEISTMEKSQWSQEHAIPTTETQQSREQDDEQYQSAQDFEYKRDLDSELFADRGLTAEADYKLQLRMLDAQNQRRLELARKDEEEMHQRLSNQEDLERQIGFEYARDLDSELDQATPDVHYHHNGEAVAEPPPEQEHHQPPHNDEELAQAAGQLLASISDDTSQKFQESTFLALMRKLRDYEVRVEGDQMIETNTPPTQENTPSTSTIPLDQQDTDDARHRDSAASARSQAQGQQIESR